MFRTYSAGAAGVPLRKLAPTSELTVTDNLRPDLAPVHGDIVGGAVAGAVLVGPAHPIAEGQRVILAGSASAPGVVALQVSPDGGATWLIDDSDSVPASEHVIGIADVPAQATHYRVRFTCGEVGASKVHFSSQARA